MSIALNYALINHIARNRRNAVSRVCNARVNVALHGGEIPIFAHEKEAVPDETGDRHREGKLITRLL